MLCLSKQFVKKQTPLQVLFFGALRAQPFSCEDSREDSMFAGHMQKHSYEIFQGQSGPLLILNELRNEQRKQCLFLHKLDVHFRIMNGYFNGDDDQYEQRTEKSQEEKKQREDKDQGGNQQSKQEVYQCPQYYYNYYALFNFPINVNVNVTSTTIHKHEETVPQVGVSLSLFQLVKLHATFPIRRLKRCNKCRGKTVFRCWLYKISSKCQKK